MITIYLIFFIIGIVLFYLLRISCGCNIVRESNNFTSLNIYGYNNYLTYNNNKLKKYKKYN